MTDGYDIIGDVHGCATKLEALLQKLGYQTTDGTGEHRHRVARPSMSAISSIVATSSCACFRSSRPWSTRAARRS